MNRPFLRYFFTIITVAASFSLRAMEEKASSPSKRPTGRFWTNSSDSESPEKISTTESPFSSPSKTPNKPSFLTTPESPSANFKNLRVTHETPPNFATITSQLQAPEPLSPVKAAKLARAMRALPALTPAEKADLTELLQNKIGPDQLKLVDPDENHDWYFDLFANLTRLGLPVPPVIQMTHIISGDRLGGGHILTEMASNARIEPLVRNQETGVICARITPKDPKKTEKFSTLFPEQFSPAHIEQIINSVHSAQTIIATNAQGNGRTKFVARDPITDIVVTGFVDDGFNYRTVFPVLFYGAETDSQFIDTLAETFGKPVKDIEVIINELKLKDPEFRRPDGISIINIGPRLSGNCGDVYIETEKTVVPSIRRKLRF